MPEETTNKLLRCRRAAEEIGAAARNLENLAAVMVDSMAEPHDWTPALESLFRRLRLSYERWLERAAEICPDDEREG